MGDESQDDPELQGNYILDDADVVAIGERFGVIFDITGLSCDDPVVFLFRPHSISKAPYLIHTGYELPVLLEGRKKLARMSDCYPPDTFTGEHRFDHWVAAGALHKEVLVEPFDEPAGRYVGHRTVYYTLPGEEWRIPAMKMLSAAAGRAGGWNEYFERLEGMLFGYSDQENDWWINVGITGGGFGGIPLCCAVDQDGLAWLEASGFRALPPVARPTIKIDSYGRWEGSDFRCLFSSDESAAAILSFNVHGRNLMDMVDLHKEGPWDLACTQIPVLNRHLRGSIIVLARRNDA